MCRQTLPKHSRLLKRRQFLYVSRNGLRCYGSQVIFQICPSGYVGACKLGITVSRKFGKANRRNYFKRIVREAFRQQRHNLPPCQIIVLPKSKHMPNFQDLLHDFIERVPLFLDKSTKNKTMPDGECSPKNELSPTASL